MNFKFKYWSNDNRGFHVKEVFCETIKQIKDTVISLKAERPDINNIEVYMGTKIVASLYDQQRNKIVGRLRLTERKKHPGQP